MLQRPTGSVIAMEPKERSFRLASIFKIRELNVLLALLVVGALIGLATPYFLAVDNLMGVFRSFSLTAIMAIGMVMVIVTGGIDLSVGSVLGLSSLMTAFAFLHGFSMPVAIASGLLSGLGVGVFNGILITWIGLPPFIATLGSLSIGRGAIYMITHGEPFTPDTPAAFAALGQGYVGFVPVPVIVLIVMAIFFPSLCAKAGSAGTYTRPAAMSMRRGSAA